LYLTLKNIKIEGERDNVEEDLEDERSPEVPDGRPNAADRLFVSEANEEVIKAVGSRIKDDIIWIFSNCLPRTLGKTNLTYMLYLKCLPTLQLINCHLIHSLIH